MGKIFSSKYFLLLAAVFCFPTLAFADTASFTIVPAHSTSSWLIYNIVPGESLKDEVTVKNLSKDTITLSLYPADKEEPAPTEPKDAFALKAKAAPMENVGKWVTLSKQTVTLPPQSEEKIGVTFAVPANTVEKQYQGGILADLAPKDVSAGVNVGSRFGLRLYANVSKRVVTSQPLASSTPIPAPAPVPVPAGPFTPLNIVLGILILAAIFFLLQSSFKNKGPRAKRK